MVILPDLNLCDSHAYLRLAGNGINAGFAGSQRLSWYYIRFYEGMENPETPVKGNRYFLK
jgi:hypothetical protein